MLEWCPPALAAAAIRSWTSAWSTPARQQHEPGGCPFGCAPPLIGDGDHLMQCPTLWAAAASALDAPILSVVQRLGVVPTPRVQRASSQGPPIGVLLNAIAVEMNHRRAALQRVWQTRASWRHPSQRTRRGTWCRYGCGCASLSASTRRNHRAASPHTSLSLRLDSCRCLDVGVLFAEAQLSALWQLDLPPEPLRLRRRLSLDVLPMFFLC